jgi:hypothetical protein
MFGDHPLITKDIHTTSGFKEANQMRKYFPHILDFVRRISKDQVYTLIVKIR